MKTKLFKNLLSALILSVFAFALILVPVFNSQAVSNNDLINSQVGLQKVGQKYGASSFSDQNQDLRVIIVKIINYSLEILGVLVLVLIVFAGYQWITAAGNEESIKKAKSLLINSVIGLAIILVAWSVTQFIFYRVLLPATTNQYYAPWF